MTRRIIPPVIHEHKFTRKGPSRDQDRCETCGMLRYDIMGPFAQRKVRMRLAYDEMETRLNRR